MSLADVRQELVDNFSSLEANLYASVPEAPIAPFIAIVPDSPYLEPNLIGKETIRVKVNFAITAGVNWASGAGALENLETLMLGILENVPVGYTVSDIMRPTITTVGASSLLVSDISVSAYYEKE